MPVVLRVVTVADLVQADGDQLCKGGRRNDSLRLQCNWPHTERPANKHWNLWRRALTATLDMGCTRHLTSNIGEWLPTTKASWQW
jgi:hypothetical protein